MMPQPPIVPAALAASLRDARRVVVLTGAGVSAESGIPTFRDASSGLWSTVDVTAVASPAGFRRDPLRVWSWYAERRRAMDAAAPNAGHRALARLEARVPELLLVTQNIDGLHRRAGSRNLVELHGAIHRARCTVERGRVLAWSADAPLPPSCPHCGGLLRPDVVWFGERLSPAALARAEAASLGADLFLSVGTSGVVEPAASLPYLAQGALAQVVEINPAPTELGDRADFALRSPAALALPALLAAAWPEPA
jgi:NAD-dependent deacetylase